MATQGVITAFFQNADGTWTCIRPVTLNHSKGRMQVSPGARFSQGEFFMGVDLAAWLDEEAKKEFISDF